MTDPAHTDEYFLGLAIEQAQIGWEEGGVPIGAALVHDGEVLAVGLVGPPIAVQRLCDS